MRRERNGKRLFCAGFFSYSFYRVPFFSEVEGESKIFLEQTTPTKKKKKKNLRRAAFFGTLYTPPFLQLSFNAFRSSYG